MSVALMDEGGIYGDAPVAEWFERRVEATVKLLEMTHLLKVRVWLDEEGRLHFAPGVGEDHDLYPQVLSETQRSEEAFNRLGDWDYGQAVVGEAYDRWIQRQKD
jgi:hypothetical protein